MHSALPNVREPVNYGSDGISQLCGRPRGEWRRRLFACTGVRVRLPPRWSVFVRKMEELDEHRTVCGTRHEHVCAGSCRC